MGLIKEQNEVVFKETGINWNRLFKIKELNSLISKYTIDENNINRNTSNKRRYDISSFFKMNIEKEKNYLVSSEEFNNGKYLKLIEVLKKISEFNDIINFNFINKDKGNVVLDISIDDAEHSFIEDNILIKKYDSFVYTVDDLNKILLFLKRAEDITKEKEMNNIINNMFRF